MMFGFLAVFVKIVVTLGSVFKRKYCFRNRDMLYSILQLMSTWPHKDLKLPPRSSYPENTDG